MRAELKNATEVAVQRALEEDVGAGDLTCQYFVSPGQGGKAVIIAKEVGVLAGSAVAAEAFRQTDEALEVRFLEQDGAPVTPGTAVLEVRGSVSAILTGERTALNFIQRLSGVATLTRRFVEAVAGTEARILDTRKTTPGLRILEKAAVVAGGGTNHRIGLYDMVMVKDNHLAAKDDLAFLASAIQRFKQEHPNIRVELEADTVEQVRGFLTLDGVDVILLDNMNLQELREAVALGQGRVQFEASGGVNLDTVRDIAATGVDFVSVGALTHSARAIDFSLELERTAVE
jgi:nicotinate-nucleotide pyrophosphorylase (carboxylating)